MRFEALQFVPINLMAHAQKNQKSLVGLRRGGGSQEDQLRTHFGQSLRVGTNEVCVVSGPNGCGKTSYLRALLGLSGLAPQELIVDGAKTNLDRCYAAGQIAWLPPVEDFSRMAVCVYEVLLNSRFALHRGFPRVEDREKVNKVLDSLAVLHLKNKAVNKLSSGQKRIVGLARILSSDARLWVLDEPFIHLDDEFKKIAIKTMCAQAELRRASIVVSSVIIGEKMQPIVAPKIEILTFAAFREKMFD